MKLRCKPTNLQELLDGVAELVQTHNGRHFGCCEAYDIRFLLFFFLLLLLFVVGVVADEDHGRSRRAAGRQRRSLCSHQSSASSCSWPSASSARHLKT